MKDSDLAVGSRRQFLGLLAAGIAAVQGTGLEAKADQGQPSSKDKRVLYESGSGDIAMAFAGDSMITRALASFREPAFLAIRDLLQSADVRFANGEMLFHNYEDWPTDFTRTYARCNPRYINDLQWLGVNLLSCANNHGIDFGQGGVVTSIRNLDAAGMVHAGSGSNYAEALAPAYLETPKGRVALLAATSTGRYESRAGDQRRDMKGRPGVNLIRWINEWTVDKESFDALHRVAAQLGRASYRYLARDYGIPMDKPDSAAYFADRNTLGQGIEDQVARYLLGDSFERHTRIHQGDYRRNLQSVRDARRMAEWVIYSVHNHEYAGKNIDEPSEHIRALAHAVIDAGADAFVGHGSHDLRGIEIYNGKPIFYSVGNFIFEPDTVLLDPEDDYVHEGLGPENTPADVYDLRISSGEHPTSGPQWYSAIPVAVFKDKHLHEIRVYPIDIGAGFPRSEAGRPMLADKKVAADVFSRLQRLCEPFHTKIEVQGNVGMIHVE